jgi:hypothetical protein
MKNFLRGAAAAAWLLIAAACPANAQSSPNLINGQVPTAGQWNSYFTAKQDVLGYVPLNVAGGVMTGRLITAPPGAATSGFNLSPGAPPASPADGDLWVTSSGLFAQIKGVTVGPLAGPSGASFAAFAPLNVSFAGSVVTYGLNADSTLIVADGKLGINLPTPNTWGGLQTFSAGVSISSAFSAPSLVKNSDLVNPSTTVNGQICTLGGNCTITASAGTVTYGVTTVAGGSGVAYNSASGGTLTAAALVNNSVLVTNGSAVPSFSATLPAAVQANITGTGTLTAGQTGLGFTLAFGSSTVTGLLGSANGGTGSNNSPFTISIGGSVVTAGPFTISGAFASQFTVTGATNSTLPAGTHTLAALDVPQSWTALQSFSGGSALGVSTGTSLALGGASIGSNALAVTGTFNFLSGGSFAGVNTFKAASGTTSVVIQDGIPASTSALVLSSSRFTISNNNVPFELDSGVGGTVNSGQLVLNTNGSISMGGALIYGGVTLNNAVTGTGPMVLGTAPSISSLTVATAFNAAGLVTFADMATAAVATSSQYLSGASNVLVPASVIYTPETPIPFSAIIPFDFSTFINALVTMTGNITTMTVTNVKAGQAGTITFIQDTIGSRTAVFSSIFKFAGGVTPTLPAKEERRRELQEASMAAVPAAAPSARRHNRAVKV